MSVRKMHPGERLREAWRMMNREFGAYFADDSGAYPEVREMDAAINALALDAADKSAAGEDARETHKAGDPAALAKLRQPSAPVPQSGAGGAAADVIAERRRQVEAEGWTPEHDDGHADGELSLAAALYAIPYDHPAIEQDHFIGLDMVLDLSCGWNLKPETDKRRRLVKAGALILAEIERLDRAALTPSEHGSKETKDA